MPRKPNPDLEDVDTEFKPTPSNAPRLAGQRDTSLVNVLVLAHNTPVGVVLDPAMGEDGEPEIDAEGKQIHRIVERRLERKERVQMQKWCADIMVKNDHVVLL